MATYPGGTYAGLSLTDNVDDIVAAHPNALSGEIVAIETELGANPKSIDDTVAAGATPSSVANYLDMVATVLKALKGTAANWHTALTGTPSATTFLRGDGSWNVPYAEPAGVIKAYGGSSAPTGYLLCDGSAVNRTTYAALFAVIADAYGVGDGSTTFNLPDLRGRVPVGLGSNGDVNALGDADAVAEASRTPNHTHTGPSHTHAQNTTSKSGETTNVLEIGASGGSGALMYTKSGGGISTQTFVQTGVVAGGTGATGAGGPPFQTVNFIIKT